MSRDENDIQKELDQWAPKLSTLPKKQASDDVPDGYFEQLPDLVWQRIQEENASANRPSESRVFRLLSPWSLGIAASLTLLVAALFWLTPSTAQEPAIESDALFAYLIDDVGFMDDETLMHVLEGDVGDMDWALEDDVLDAFLDEHLEDMDDTLLEDIF